MGLSYKCITLIPVPTTVSSVSLTISESTGLPTCVPSLSNVLAASTVALDIEWRSPSASEALWSEEVKVGGRSQIPLDKFQIGDEVRKDCI